MREGDYQEASKLNYETIPEIEKAIAEAEAVEQSGPRMVNDQVTEDDIAAVVAAWTGIPVGRLTQGETEKLLHLEAELGKRLIGQKRAVRAVADAVRRIARGHLRPRPADRLLPVPRPHRRRQDRARQGARRVPVRRREGHGAHRHERVRREVLRRRGSSAPLPGTSATSRAASSPRRCAGGRTA